MRVARVEEIFQPSAVICIEKEGVGARPTPICFFFKGLQPGPRF
jgi:hypothetical protein